MKRLLIITVMLLFFGNFSIAQLRMPTPDVAMSDRVYYNLDPQVERRAAQVAITLSVQFLACVIISRTEYRDPYYGITRAVFIGTAIGGSFYIFHSKKWK